MIKTEGYENSELFMALTPKNGFKASKLYSYKPIDGTGDFHWSKNHTAYRLNQSGVLELMGNNVPRVDYTNTCPELLIEKASTNRIIQSNDFSNASWIKNNLTNSFGLLTTTATNNSVFIGQNSIGGFINGNTYTLSIFAKKGSTNFIQLLLGTGQSVGNAYANFDLNNGTFSLGAGVSASIRLVDDYYRCTLTYVSNVTGSNDPIIWLIDSLVAARIANFTGSIGSTLSIKFAQQEQSDFATSYIPTTTTTQTRPQDICYNTANGFGDTAWSVVMRVRLNNIGSNTFEPLLALNDGSNEYYFCIYTDSNPKLYFDWYNNPDQDTYSTTDLTNGIYNIGVSFDSTTADYIIVIDGNLEFAGTLVTNPAGLFGNFTRLDLGSIAGTGSPDGDGIIGVQYYDSALSQTDLENLTTA